MSGTCIANYTGSPTRQCIQNGSNGVWNSIVTNPCNRIAIFFKKFFILIKFIMTIAIMCSNETYNNANWSSIQSGQIANGTCITNYYGSPTRQCILNGSNGTWSSNVLNPCNRNNFLIFFFI